MSHRRDDREDRRYREEREHRDERRPGEDDRRDRESSRRSEDRIERTGKRTRVDPSASEPEQKKRRAEPLSLEELVERKKQEEARQSKPKFLTKAERAQQALAKRQREHELKQKEREEARRARMQFLQQAEEQKDYNRPEDRRGGDRGRYDDRRGDRRRAGRGGSGRDDRKGDRGREGDRRREGNEDRERPTAAGLLPGREAAEEQRELEAIRKQYLGGPKQKRKVQKTTEKFHIRKSFNWDLDDDTAADHNGLYSEPVMYKPAFGKGFIAGVDQVEQAEAYCKQLGSGKKKEVLEEELAKLRHRGERYLREKHWKDKTLEEMTDRDWRIFKEDFNITSKGGSLPNPLRSWEEANLPQRLHEAVREAGYTMPSAIQMQAIPIALRGRDVLGVAETGSGKTAAFVLPMLVYIAAQPPMDEVRKKDGPYALIMAPTRELALQIKAETDKFARHMNVRTVAVVGGQHKEEQGYLLAKGCEVIIATPGRMIDCLRNHYAVLNQCNYVVLDEADKMIDMGFEEQVKEILDAMPSAFLKSEDETEAEWQERQKDRVFRTTIMYSATMPPGVERLSRNYLRRPAYISIGEAGKAVDAIVQNVIMVKNDAEKRSKLLEALEYTEAPIIVFVNIKRDCDNVAKYIREVAGLNCTVLHSGKTQQQRELSLNSFKDGRVPILVATDVAGRGIHIDSVQHVINYDLPNTIRAYTHRIGRTGRAGAKGLATSLMTGDDTAIMYDLRQMLQTTGNVIPSELKKNPASQFKAPPGGYDKGPVSLEANLFSH